MIKVTLTDRQFSIIRQLLKENAKENGFVPGEEINGSSKRVRELADIDRKLVKARWNENLLN